MANFLGLRPQPKPRWLMHPTFAAELISLLSTESWREKFNKLKSLRKPATIASGHSWHFCLIALCLRFRPHFLVSKIAKSWKVELEIWTEHEHSLQKIAFEAEREHTCKNTKAKDFIYEICRCRFATRVVIKKQLKIALNDTWHETKA